MMTLRDTVAVVTGGGAGIGLAVAPTLAEGGAKVLITGRRADAMRMAAVTHPAIEGIVADASSTADADASIAAAIERWGQFDILVNSAGVGLPEPLADVSPESIESVYKTNVFGPTLLAK